MAVDPLMPKAQGGKDTRDNLQLVPRHCHEKKTASQTGCQGTHDLRHVAEEPDERKRSRPVVEPSRGGDTPAEAAGGRGDAAFRGHVGRTGRAGAPTPTSLRGRAFSQTSGRAAARRIEEPGAGILHAGICAGGVG